ncbi:hypothetical protein MP228_008669 [Amoeboaphelidium protococcarum]|nr:hypothetical protein MP228_008669 [Amoeboaphelidium protococcarum]
MATKALPIKYGFIGLGAMGNPMAKNILQKLYDPNGGGNSYTVLENNSDNLRLFQEQAKEFRQVIKVANSPAEVVQQSDAVITMLPSPQIVKSVWLSGKDSLLAGLKAQGSTQRPPKIIIDCSTIDPLTSRECSEALQSLGHIAVDAPVSGGQGGAKNGTLTFMVGTEDVTAFEKVKQVLQPMGQNFFQCGAAGNGQAAKLCNNLMLAIGMLATSETLTLGTRLGIDATVLSKIMNVSSGQSWSLTKYNPHPNVLDVAPSSSQYKPGFGMQLMQKDIKLALESAEKVKSPLPLGAITREVYRLAAAEDNNQNKDFSVVYKWLNEH